MAATETKFTSSTTYNDVSFTWATVKCEKASGCHDTSRARGLAKNSCSAGLTSIDMTCAAMNVRRKTKDTHTFLLMSAFWICLHFLLS